ncbi:MAG: CoA pyrophosphatase [Xanthomonadales bacterium]
MSRRWRDRLIEAVSPLQSGVRGLQVNGFRPPDVTAYRPARTAAVLVPIIDLPDPLLVLTRRADHLPNHPGQVCFPGGAAEEDDATAVETALREAEEEIGLPPDAAQPIGFLDRMDTVSDYRVLPVVALIRPPVHWRPDAREVSEVFTVPASIALDRSRYEVLPFERDGQVHTVHVMEWQGKKIWGVTAGMLINLIARLERADEQAEDSAVRRAAE